MIKQVYTNYILAEIKKTYYKMQDIVSKVIVNSNVNFYIDSGNNNKNYFYYTLSVLLAILDNKDNNSIFELNNF